MRLAASSRQLATALFLLVGCAGLPDVRAGSAYGVVLAPDSESAAETVRLWNDVAPRLGGLGAGLEIRPVEVWLFDRVDDETVYGGYDTRHRRSMLDVERAHPAVTLAHELVHAYEPPTWDRLPAVVREGLADWLASRAVPEKAAQMRASRAISLGSYAVGGLPVPVDGPAGVMTVRMGVPVDTDLTPLAALRIPHGHVRAVRDGATLKALYGMGLLIVTRAGLERLTRLSLDARAAGLELVPPERILEAARLGEDPATWLSAIEDLIAAAEDQAEVRRLLGIAPRAVSPGDPAASPGGMRD